MHYSANIFFLLESLSLFETMLTTNINHIHSECSVWLSYFSHLNFLLIIILYISAIYEWHTWLSREHSLLLDIAVNLCCISFIFCFFFFFFFKYRWFIHHSHEYYLQISSVLLFFFFTALFSLFFDFSFILWCSCICLFVIFIVVAAVDLAHIHFYYLCWFLFWCHLNLNGYHSSSASVSFPSINNKICHSNKITIWKRSHIHLTLQYIWTKMQSQVWMAVWVSAMLLVHFKKCSKTIQRIIFAEMLPKTLGIYVYHYHHRAYNA